MRRSGRGSWKRGAAAGLVASLVVLTAATSSWGAAAGSSHGKLRPDLAALVTGSAKPDARVARLTPGYRADELVYFAVLRTHATAPRAAALSRLGARVLRAYTAIDAFELASSRRVVRRVAALPWVSWLAPVEVVQAAADEASEDQTRGTAADVGAPAWWNQGVTGSGVRIGVLDTGLEPTHPDLDDLDFRHWSGVLNPPKVVDSKNFVGGVQCGTPTRARRTGTDTERTWPESRSARVRGRRWPTTTAATQESRRERSSRSPRC